jgi:anaerobic magnesium-protoporphyrin IX monomethyl ester cyclase
VGPKAIAGVLLADDWDVIGLGGITTVYGSIKRFVATARHVCPNALIVLGGGVLTSLAREVMGFLPEVDIGVVGEAFVTFPEILDHIDHGNRDWPKVEGTISRRADGSLVFAPKRDLIHDLDVLPYPAWDLFPLEEVYFPNSQVLFSEEGMLARRRLDINASYGCSLICRYCFHLGIAGDMRYAQKEEGGVEIEFDNPSAHTRTIRYHSPEYVVKLVKHAFDRYGIDFIGFLDENLMPMDQFSRRVWMKEICRLWLEAGLQPTCVRDGVPHDESCRGVHWSGTRCTATSLSPPT